MSPSIRRCALFAAAIFLGLPIFPARPAAAQTISPVIVEYREKAKGSFQVTNDSFVPMTVVLEARSFSVDLAGNPTFRALDPGIHIELSSLSFRVAPQQSYTVFYKAEADRLPAWFCIYASITGPQAQNGLQLVIELPHTVYLLTRRPLDRESVVVSRVERSGKGLEAEIENRGAEFSRVRQVDVLTSEGKQEFPGFPLFPGQKRKLTIELAPKGQPQTLVLAFDKFKVESPVRPTSSP
jgi:P pilus assembly chaperone PapD